MAREDFSATPVCNEWWLPSGRGLGALGANLLVEDGFSALISVANAPEKDGPTVEQTRVFEAALRHIIRAVRISGQFWGLDLGPATAPERLENRGYLSRRGPGESGFRESRREGDARRR
jgi:hypothetical protein